MYARIDKNPINYNYPDKTPIKKIIIIYEVSIHMLL